MKILYVATTIGTINAFLIPHIEHLIQQGHQVEIACNTKRGIDSRIMELGCKVHDVNFQRYPFNRQNYSAYKKIKRIILSESYELIHTHTPIASFLTRMACRNIGDVKVIYTAHGFHFYKGAPIKNWIIYYPAERIAAKWTDSIITINDEDYELARKMRLRKLKLVFKVHGVGIDLCKFSRQAIQEKNKMRKRYGYNDEEFIMFYAAELNHNKHQDFIINVVKELKEKIPNIKLLLAGDGCLKEKYWEQSRRLGLSENVEFLGRRNDVPNLLRISDVYISSSRREGLPVSVLEAMATGLPVIVTDIRGHRDLICNGKNGYIIKIDDLKAFTGAVEKLYYSKELRGKMGRENLELVGIYSIENVLMEMNVIYARFLNE